MSLTSIFRRASSSIVPLPSQDRIRLGTARDYYYAAPSAPRISISDRCSLAKHIPPELPFLVLDYGTDYGLILKRRYQNETVLGKVEHFYNYRNRDPEFLVEFSVIKENLYIVFGTTVARDSIYIQSLIMRSPMFWGHDPVSNRNKLSYLKGFDKFIESKGIDSSTIKFLFDRFENVKKQPVEMKNVEA